MKKIISTFIILAIFLPVVSFAGNFDDSPFDNIYNSDSKCWRGEVHLVGPSEQVVRQNVNTEVKKSYSLATGVPVANLPSYAPFVVETSSTPLYDEVNKKYHFFAAAVYPMPGIQADCVKAVPSSNTKTVVTPEGSSLIQNSAAGKAAAAAKAAADAAAAAAASLSAGGIAGGVAGSNPNPDTPGDIKGKPLYSGSASSNVDTTYKPGPSGLVSDCNRGDTVMQYTTGKNGLLSGDVAFQNNCGFDDLMALINKVINFLLFVIATPLVAIGLCYAGFLYLTSGGSSEKTGQAKSILMNLVVGYIVALIAWVVVKTIMVSLGFDSTGIFLEI